MNRSPPAIGTLFAILLSLASAALARAMPEPRVLDEAGFFSADAVARANQLIAQIKKDHGKDLYVETHQSIPSSLRSRLEQQGADSFFSDWVNQRAREQKVDGIMVLITREPSRLQVGTGADTGRQPFIQTDRDKLRDILLTDFRAQQFDRGLLRGVEFVGQTLDQTMGRAGASGATADPAASSAAPAPGKTAPVTSPPPAGEPRKGWSMGSILCVGAAVVLVFLLVRGFLASRRAASGPGGAAGYGPGTYGQPPAAPGGKYGGHPAPGSGMGRGFLGGLLGGMLGGYAYDRFARGGEPSQTDASAMDSSGQPGASVEPPPSGTDIGSDFSSSGGEFGGDAGGGDFGGGGGDGGSSGGDF